MTLTDIMIFNTETISIINSNNIYINFEASNITIDLTMSIKCSEHTGSVIFVARTRLRHFVSGETQFLSL